MQTSQTISEICKALTLFHVKVESINKDAKNPFFKSTYATLQNIQDAIREPLIECGLTVSQHPEGEHGLTTIVMHSSGEWMISTYIMKPVKNDPQGIGSCISYQKRYALTSILNLSIGDPDDDGNKASGLEQKTNELGSLPKIREKVKPEMKFNTKEFNGAIEKLKARQTTISKIKEFYTLTKEVEDRFRLIDEKTGFDAIVYGDENSPYYRGR